MPYDSTSVQECIRYNRDHKAFSMLDSKKLVIPVRAYFASQSLLCDLLPLCGCILQIQACHPRVPRVATQIPVIRFRIKQNYRSLLVICQRKSNIFHRKRVIYSQITRIKTKKFVCVRNSSNMYRDKLFL